MLCLSAAAAVSSVAADADAEVQARLDGVLEAAGGRQNLLTLFRITENLNVSSDPLKPANKRASVLEPPSHWWVGKKDRVTADKEPATFLVWAWTLGALTDPQSKIELIPETDDGEHRVFGFRVSETISPPMELYFDARTSLLHRIDWRSDVHRFSDWKEADGVKYPSKCIGYKKVSGKPWYYTEIIELERLQQLPAGLQR